MTNFKPETEILRMEKTMIAKIIGELKFFFYLSPD